jgi:hypothetical protein
MAMANMASAKLCPSCVPRFVVNSAAKHNAAPMVAPVILGIRAVAGVKANVPIATCKPINAQEKFSGVRKNDPCSDMFAIDGTFDDLQVSRTNLWRDSKEGARFGYCLFVIFAQRNAFGYTSSNSCIWIVRQGC